MARGAHSKAGCGVAKILNVYSKRKSLIFLQGGSRLLINKSPILNIHIFVFRAPITYRKIYVLDGRNTMIMV